MAGIVLAAAGVIRLGWEERITEMLPEDIMLPAVGQGSIAVEIASHRDDMKELLVRLNHRQTELNVRAERALLRELEGGCQIPIGAFCLGSGTDLALQGLVASLDGRRLIRASARGTHPEELGCEVAQLLLLQGAGEILEEVRQAAM